MAEEARTGGDHDGDGDMCTVQASGSDEAYKEDKQSEKHEEGEIGLNHVSPADQEKRLMSAMIASWEQQSRGQHT